MDLGELWWEICGDESSGLGLGSSEDSCEHDNDTISDY